MLTFAALIGAVYLAMNLETEEPKKPETVAAEPETTAPTQPETTVSTEAPAVPAETKLAQKSTEKTVKSNTQAVKPQQTVPVSTTPLAVPSVSQTAPAPTQPTVTEPQTEPWTPAPSAACAHTTLIGAGQECFEHFAKCTTPGNGVYVCAACHEVVERPEPERYPAKGHDPVVEQDGSSWCYRCGVVLSGPTVTEPPATEPQPSIPTIAETVPAEPQETLPVTEVPSELPPVQETPIDK